MTEPHEPRGILQKLMFIYQQREDHARGEAEGALSDRQDQHRDLRGQLASFGERTLDLILDEVEPGGIIKQFDEVVSLPLARLILLIAHENQGTENIGLLRKAVEALDQLPVADQPSIRDQRQQMRFHVVRRCQEITYRK